MTPIDDLIQDIKQIVLAQEAHDELSVDEIKKYRVIAQNYAYFYNEAKERLVICRNHLANKMREEALREADNEPNLLTLWNELNFREMKEWRHLCEKHHFSFPELVDEKLKNVLQLIYGVENQLQPFLKEYRRAAHKHEHRKCILILREIAKIDGVNKAWGDDLKEFEKVRLQEIRTEFNLAIKNNDLDQLGYLIAEMDEKWTIQRDDALYQEIKGYASRKEISDVKLKAKKIVEALLDAYQKGNFKSAEEPLKEYDVLRKSKYFDNQTTDPDYIKIAAWFENSKKNEASKIEQDKENKLWQDSVDKLYLAIQQGTPHLVSTYLEHLKSFKDRLIPEDALIAAVEIINKWKFRRKMAYGCAAVVIMIVLVLLFMFGKYEYVKFSKIEELEQAYLEDNLLQFLALLKEIKQHHQPLLESKQIQQWFAKVSDVEKKLEQKKIIFDSTMHSLQKINTEELEQNKELVDQLLNEAQLNAVTSDELGRLTVIRNEFEVRKKLISSKHNKAIGEMLNIISEKMKQIESSITNNHLKPITDLLKEIEDLFIKVSHDYWISSELKENLTKLNVKLEAIQLALQLKTKQIQSITDAQRFSDYMKELKSYAAAFPADLFTQSIENIVDKEPLYNSLLLKQRGDVADPFWYSGFQLLDKIKNNASKLKAFTKQLANEKWLVDLWEMTFIRNKKKVYFEQAPQETRDSLGILNYLGILYNPSPSDNQPEFIRKELATALFDAKTLKPLNHCKYVLNLINTLTLSEPEDSYQVMLSQMEKLMNENFSPVLKAYIMELLITALIDLIGEENAQEWKTVLTDLNTIDKDIHWLCVENPKIDISINQANAILDRYFNKKKMISVQKAQLKILSLSLNRPIQWIGYIALDNTQEIIWKHSVKSKEVWVIRVIDQKPKIVLAQEFRNNEWKRSPDVVHYVPGEPVFFPDSVKTSREILKEVFSEFQLSNDVRITIPSAWPVNITEL
ncbi:MAG: hypothetical protein HQK77_06290 [Desulfobacterales bacterium]|nr:hypothetical protein [Desulfobacterales bacterium]